MSTLFSQVRGARVSKSEPLCRHTSFRIGGKADYFIRVNSLRALRQTLSIVNARRMRYFVIGAGTNVLASDDGFRGAVIKLVGLFKTFRQEGDRFFCYSGMQIDKFLDEAALLGYGGAEFLAGIPGTIGGGVKGNAGAFGKSFADIVESVVIWDSEQTERKMDHRLIGFSYRRTRIVDNAIIIGAIIRMERKRPSVIERQLKEKRSYRWRLQPAGYSAGSFFKNPVCGAAGQLIDECGLKNMRVGEAEVSEKHANFIINRGHARAVDVLRLARTIKKIVKAKKGVLLKEEVRLLK